jgi:hypothetical protein
LKLVLGRKEIHLKQNLLLIGQDGEDHLKRVSTVKSYLHAKNIISLFTGRRRVGKIFKNALLHLPLKVFDLVCFD